MTDKNTYQTPHILPDNPLEDITQAQFHFDDFAATLARLIADKHTQTPLTIGINGTWGTGKTTLLRCIQGLLNQTKVLLQPEEPTLSITFANPNEDPERMFRACRTVWFNAWKYSGEDELLIALVRAIVQEMFKDDFISKGAAAIFEPFTERRDVINTVLSWFQIKTSFGDFKPGTGNPQATPFAEKTALLDLFDKAFDRLAAAWVHRKTDLEKIDPTKGVLVVFIDDLDRCLPEKTVQVLEAVKLFLDKPGCVFVLAADVGVVQEAVSSYYQNAKITGQNAADYLDKIIQLRFDIPPVVRETMQSFLETQQVTEETLAQWETLIAAAEVNPRRVKRVFNDVELQWKMLVNSRQAQGVRKEDFIRWSALMRAAPANFRERLTDITDIDLRFKFIQDALRWGSGEGDEILQRTFQEYERPRRLLGVLREIKIFSAEFDAKTLEAFIHLTAPPPKPQQPIEQKAASEGKPETEAVEMEGMPSKSMAGRGEAETSRVREYGGLQFVHVPAGKFLMGSKEDNKLADGDEKPQHTAETGEFWLARFPVSNTQFEAFVNVHPYKTTAEDQGSGYAYDGKDWKDIKGADWRHPQGPKSSLKGKEEHPVVQVSWLDAMLPVAEPGPWCGSARGLDFPPAHGGRVGKSCPRRIRARLAVGQRIRCKEVQFQ